LSEKFGAKIMPDEEHINDLGYQFLNMKQFKKAENFLTLNVANYPDSFNAYDSLGDFYVALENNEKAIKNFKESISLNKDSASKDKLKKLQKE